MKKVFITGATSGIGLALAQELAALKIPLVLNGRRLDRLRKIQQELSAQTSVELAPFDVSDSQAVESWVSQNQNILKTVNVLVNNAGLARGTDPVQRANFSDWQEMLDTNVRGLMHMTHQIVPFLLQNKPSHIVNIGSVAGRWTYPGGTVYCATKFAVRAFSEGLRMDLLGQGVRVTNIEPGMVETEFSMVRFQDADKAKQVYQGLKPLTGKDIASSIVWCLQQPEHVNIQELVIFPTDQASPRDVNRQF